MEILMRLDGVSYRYSDSISALAAVSLDIHEGENLAIVGANGSGKSTLLQVLGGLIHPAAGSYFFRGSEVTEISLRNKGFLKRFRESVGYLFQDSDVQLFCPTVLDEILYGPLQLEIAVEERMSRASEVMRMLEIGHLRDRPPYMLSGGEKKRVALASILTMNPRVLLLDEPTQGLDPRTQSFLVELLFALNEAGKTLVIATHDLGLVDELRARTAVLSEEHRIEKVGESEEILKDKELLLRVNLIHEHLHRHGPMAHRHLHSHYLFHKH